MKCLVAKVALAAFASSRFVPFSKANVYTNPKARVATACGYVVDSSGAAIPGAKVEFATDSIFQFVVRDDRGYFHAEFIGPKVRVTASAVGFQTASSLVEALVNSKKGCSKPLYVMLQVGGDGCTLISTKESDLPVAKKD